MCGMAIENLKAQNLLILAGDGLAHVFELALCKREANRVLRSSEKLLCLLRPLTRLALLLSSSLVCVFASHSFFHGCRLTFVSRVSCVVSLINKHTVTESLKMQGK